MVENKISITVAYASETEQVEIALEMPVDSTVRHAIERSQILRRFPEINLAVNKIGLFGQLATLETLLYPGDRVEIYRPLKYDPKEMRRKKVI